jgi:hypothetical protein
VPGQALFTLLVAMLFAQIAPVSWRLAEVRVLDVVLGGLLGAVVGLLVWPFGAKGEMRRTARTTVDAAADDLESTVRSLAHREVASSDQPDTASTAVRRLMLADSTYAQYRSELNSAPDPVDWLGVLRVVQEVVRGGQVLRNTHGMAGPLPWPGVAGDLERFGVSTADQLRAISGLISENSTHPHATTKGADLAVESWVSTDAAREVVRRESDPVSAVRVLDIWGWLVGVFFDSRREIDRLEQTAGSR